MHLLRSVLFLRKIYGSRQPLAVLIDYGYLAIMCWLGLALAYESGGLYLQYAMYGAISLTTLLAIRRVVQMGLVHQFTKDYPPAYRYKATNEIAKTAVNQELGSIDRVIPLSVDTDKQTFIAVMDSYRHSKYGNYLSFSRYYMVSEILLDRTLPHILFDSTAAKSRQFSQLYESVQQISVQGGFDEVFDTYVPQGYSIDTLSFITPEVMEVLLAYRSYDIEIVNDKLFLYGPVTDKRGIDEQMRAAQELAKEINDNIDTYRDDRLSGAARKTDVTPFGRTLLRSPMRAYVLSALFGSLSIAIVVATIRYRDDLEFSLAFNQGSVLIYIFFISNLYQAIKITRQNKKAYRRFGAQRIKR